MPDLIEHDEKMSRRVADAGQSETLRHAWREFSCCLGIAAGKQRNLMAFSDKLLGEPGDDTLSSAVKSWGNSFCQRRNLGIA